MELARSLPEENVEYNAGDLPVSVDPAIDAAHRPLDRGDASAASSTAAPGWCSSSSNAIRPTASSWTGASTRCSRSAEPRAPRHQRARGVHVRLVAERGDAVPHRSRAQLPAPDPRLEDDGRVPRSGPLAHHRAGARELLLGGAPQPGLPRAPIRTRPRCSGSIPATASTCRSPRRTGCGTAIRSRCR